MANSIPTAGSYPTKHRKREAKVIETARQGLGASDLVKQTITNGVTSSAPSQDAVYDALALKAVAASTPVIFNVATPAGMKAGDINVYGGAVVIYDGTAWIPIITV